MPKHSFVLPVYNEEKVLHELWRRLRSELCEAILSQGENFEVVFVDDGSKDRSYEILQEIRAQDPEHVVVVHFSRNFGHQAAVTAGMDTASGDTVTMMDADLQDPPTLVLRMIEKWREGFDVVFAVREKRLQETWFKKITASLFYRILRAATSPLEIPLDAGDFRLLSRRACDAFNSLRETHRFIRGMTRWIGFKQGSVTYTRDARFAGETKYTLRKMFGLAWDAFTGFTLIPLRIASVLGIVSACLSIPLGLWALYVRFVTHDTVPGWTSLIVVILFIGGIQLFCLGLLGEYVGLAFEELKRRPLYIVETLLSPDTNASQAASNKPHR